MNRAQFLLKLGVVASSFLLVGTYVSYRAGAFSRLTGPRDEPAMIGGSKSAPVFHLSLSDTSADLSPTTSEISSPGNGEAKPVFLPGSKSPCD